MLALAFGQVPAAQREAALSRLTELIRAAYNHLDTGFLSVPFLLEALSANGHAGLARTLLWQETAPSWLYAVDRGATTIWEEWSAIRPDGEVGTASFNHYAFGCVDEWLYGHLAGIRPASPGFRTSRIEPDLDADLDWVEAWQDTPYGLLKVRWERDADDPALFTIDVEVPPNTMSALALPERAGSVQAYRNGRPVPVRLGDLGSGPVTVTLRMDPGVSPDESTARYGVRGQLSRCPAGMPFISTIPASGLWWCGTARGHGKIGAVRPGDKGLVGCERAAGDLNGARGG